MKLYSMRISPTHLQPITVISLGLSKWGSSHNSYLHSVTFLIAENVELTSNKESQFTCPGDQVTFTCRVFESSSLEWRSPLITQTFAYISTDTPLQTFIRGSFTATLISVSGSALNSNFTSTLQVTASRMFMRNETTVTCLNSASDNKTDNFTMAGKLY